MTLASGDPINAKAVAVTVATLLLAILFRKLVRRYQLPQFDMLAVLMFVEALAIAKSIANQTRQTLDFNRQCLAEGIANLVGGFFQCLPGSGSLSRSAINFQAGAATRLSGIMTAAFVAIAVLGLAPLSRYVPKPALAALLLLTAAR